ncbi:MAG: cyclodeaminase/cyclohydrolase family protein [Porphyromonas sp.]|nr:cyclodeaminase/cyclohydrolase family protein [Bacteroidales bacterium]MDY3101156.1 cyclodeaminase/cyclohydrolase family protein [Porphyromonas sp.]
MLTELSLQKFIDVTAGSDPVPGGGSISALAGTLSAALTHMVAGLTIGKKKYLEVEDEMKTIAEKTSEIQALLYEAIDRDSEAYNVVFDAFKLPKETDEEKKKRSEAIQEATKVAADVPMEVAEMAFSLIPYIKAVVAKGNQNAVTDGCVAMLCCRTAVLGALLNVRINLGSIKDQDFVKEYEARAKKMEDAISDIEKEILETTYRAI